MKPTTANGRGLLCINACSKICTGFIITLLLLRLIDFSRQSLFRDNYSLHIHNDDFEPIQMNNQVDIAGSLDGPSNVQLVYDDSEEEEEDTSHLDFTTHAEIEVEGIPYDELMSLAYDKSWSWENVPQNLRLHPDEQGKFFVYQPSGGWGNQRIILQNAIAAANAMNRILVLPPIAPHNFLYYGYNKFSANEMVSMAQVLDLDLLSKVVTPGIKVWNSTLEELEKFWDKKTWKIYSKPRHDKDGSKLFFSSPFMQRHWGESSSYDKYDVMFWNKEGMWLCCGPSSQYGEYISLNRHLKAVAMLVSRAIDENMNYNAVHIRRGGGHTGKDRKTAVGYFKEHMKSFEKDVPLYIATDEKDKIWFLPFKDEFSFHRILFFEDVTRNPEVKQLLETELSRYPATMKNDITGFIEQLVCARAKRFSGSQASTFSVAIKKFRDYKKLLRIRN